MKITYFNLNINEYHGIFYPMIPFYIINNISISVNTFDSNFAFLRLLTMLIILVRKKNGQNQAYIFENTYLWKFLRTSARNNLSL